MTGYRSVLAVREFRVILGSTLGSSLGDQVARVALVVLVYGRTGSTLASAATIAVPFLTYVVAGPLLGPLADRMPARGLMVACDALRATVFAAMALADASIPALLGLIVVAELATAPFEAARGALLPDVLTGDAYVVGNGLSSALHQVAQVAGFGVGGLALAVVTPSTLLLVDAVSFALSALLLRTCLCRRARRAPGGRPTPLRDVRAGVALVARNPRLRLLLGLAWLVSGVSVLPEGLAAAVASASGGGAGAVGLLMGAGPAGCATAAVVLTRLVGPERRMSLLVPLLLLTCAPLTLAVLDPGLLLLAVLVALAGAGSSCIVLVQTTVGREVAPANRGAVFGIAGGGLMASQGAGLVLAGGLGTVLPVHLVVAGAGAVGLAVAACLGVSWTRVNAAATAPAQPAALAFA